MFPNQKLKTQRSHRSQVSNGDYHVISSKKDTESCKENCSEKELSEFKLMKKIAELTHVVNILFQSNHTNETELKILKLKIAEDYNSTRKKHDEQITSSENEKVKQAAEVERLKKELSIECCKFKTSNEELTNLRKENNQLTHQLQQTEARLAELQKSSASFDVKVEMLKRDVVAKDEIIKKLEAETEHYKNENRALKNENMVIDGRLKTYETYASKEKEEKKREFAEKLKCETEAVVNSSSDKTSCGEEHDLDPSQTNSSQKKQAKKENNSDLYLERARTQVMMEDNLEIIRLRNELTRAKLELANRESNFNRVFSSNQPVLVNDSNFQWSSKDTFPPLLSTSSRSIKSREQVRRRGVEINSHGSAKASTMFLSRTQLQSITSAGDRKTYGNNPRFYK